MQAVPGLPVPGMFLGGTVYYRPSRELRRRGFIIFHEFAHGLLERLRIGMGLDYNHADVQALALMLMVPRSWLSSALRRLGPRGCRRALARDHRHAPLEFLRLRVELVSLAKAA